MPSGVFKITDIPMLKVSEVEAMFRLDKPKNIERIDQGNGLWTVVATFPGPGNDVKKFPDQ